MVSRIGSDYEADGAIGLSSSSWACKAMASSAQTECVYAGVTSILIVIHSASHTPLRSLIDRRSLEDHCVPFALIVFIIARHKASRKDNFCDSVDPFSLNRFHCSGIYTDSFLQLQCG